MTKKSLSLNPVDLITVDAIGKPGNRIFYIQGRKGSQAVSLIIEKIQLQSLIAGIGEFIKQLEEKFPELGAPEMEIDEEAMRIQPPVDPQFRVGDMGLTYDDERDLACIIAREIDLPGEGVFDEAEDESAEEDDANVVRYWCTRGQLAALANWGSIVIERGRPICPQCLQPMEPEGHFCPKKNGHKKPVAD